MQEPFQQDNDLLFINSWMHQNENLIAGFTTKRNGVSRGECFGLNIAYHVGDNPDDVLKNREIIAQTLNVPLSNWVFAQQLHTTTIHKVTNNDLGRGVFSFDSGISACDGLYTTETDIMLATFYADCTPLFFFSPKHHVVGVAHAGWRGTVDGMMTQMLNRLKTDEQINPKDIYVAIGPCIGKDAYRVDDTVIKEVKKSPLQQSNLTYTQLNETQYKFDAKLMNKLQALAEGVPEENILVSSYCTFTDSDLFYSYRKNKQTGRMMSFISLNSNA